MTADAVAASHPSEVAVSHQLLAYAPSDFPIPAADPALVEALVQPRLSLFWGAETTARTLLAAATALARRGHRDRPGRPRAAVRPRVAGDVLRRERPPGRLGAPAHRHPRPPQAPGRCGPGDRRRPRAADAGQGSLGVARPPAGRRAPAPGPCGLRLPPAALRDAAARHAGRGTQTRPRPAASARSLDRRRTRARPGGIIVGAKH